MLYLTPPTPEPTHPPTHTMGICPQMGNGDDDTNRPIVISAIANPLSYVQNGKSPQSAPTPLCTEHYSPTSMTHTCTHRSVGPLLASMLASPSLHFHMHAVDDTEEVLHHRHPSVVFLV